MKGGMPLSRLFSRGVGGGSCLSATVRLVRGGSKKTGAPNRHPRPAPHLGLNKATKLRQCVWMLQPCGDPHTELSPPCISPSPSSWVPKGRRTQPSVPRGLLHSGKGMEVIHSGNCDCPFPGRGCAFPGWPRPPSLPGCTARPRGPAASRRTRSPGRGGKGRCGALAGSALHLPRPPGAPEVPPPPPAKPPGALCYSPTSCLRPPDPGSLPGPGSRRRPRVSRRRPRPPGSASCLHESRPGPGSPLGAGAPAAGSRCGQRAGGRDGPGPAARHQRALRGRRGPPSPAGPRVSALLRPGARADEPGEGAAGWSSVLVLVAQPSLRRRPRGSKLQSAQATLP